MKSILVIGAILLSQSYANASLLCTATKKANHDYFSIRLHAEGMSNDRKTGQIVLENVTAVVKSNDETETGKGKVLRSDLNYVPRKYVDHRRIVLTNLKSTTDTSLKGRFYPADQCEIQVMIPVTWADGEGFTAPTLVHCDQSGGVTNLECQNL
jgi:hypothetical protein